MENRVKGNYIAFSVPIVLKTITQEGITEQAYIPTMTDNIKVRLVGYNIRTYVPAIDGGNLVFSDNGTLSVGKYGLEVLIEREDGKHLRSYEEDVLNIVNETKDADETTTDEALEIESTMLAYSRGGEEPIPVSGMTEEEVRALVTQLLSGYARMQDLNGKVDKESGKGLSTNDYTSNEKNKLRDLPTNEELARMLADKVAKVVGKGLSTNDFTDEEKAKLANLVNYDDSALVQRLLALEEIDHTTFLTKTEASSTYQPKGNYLTEHQSLTDYLTKTLAQQTYQPKGEYLTEHQSLAAYLTKALAEQTYQPKGNYLTEHQSLSGYLTSADAQQTYQPKGNYLTQHQDISGKADKELVVTMTNETATIEPNKFYVWGEVTDLDISFAIPTDNTRTNVYHFRFTAGANAMFAVPANVIWQNNQEPPRTEGNTYEVSILNGCASYMEFEPYEE